MGKSALKHYNVSMAKSVIRIISCILAAYTMNVVVLAVGMGIAELLGVLEEVVDRRKE